MTNDIILETIKDKKLIVEGDAVILGLSGGPDSLCLFDVLNKNSKDMGFSLYCAHLNHMFRKETAEKDQEFVKNLCYEKNITLYDRSVDCIALSKELDQSSEEVGRAERYKLFDDAAKDIEKKGIPREKIKIAVAQNENDQAETVLFRILRGTGVDGLAGIEYERNSESGYKIIRPLLDASRPNIEDYCKEQGLVPCIDETNAKPIYTRNKIRLGVLPYFQKNFNKNIIGALNRLSLIAKDDKETLWKIADKNFEDGFISRTKNTVTLDQKILSECDKSIFSRVCIRAFREIGLDQDITFLQLGDAQKIVMQFDEPRMMNFTKGYVLRVMYGKVVFENEKALKMEFKKPSMNLDVIAADKMVQNKELAYFDFDLIKAEYPYCEILFRTREQSDFIRLKGMEGRKKIKNLFIDMKIPKDKRENLYLVAVGNEILFIPEQGFRARYNYKFNVTKNTKNVLTVEIK